MDRSGPGVRIVKLSHDRASEGEPLDLEGRIIGFTFEDAERKADRVSLQLDNYDLSLFGRPELKGGSILEVSWGYPELMSPPRRVIIKKYKGFTRLTVEGHALSAMLNSRAKIRHWENVTRSDVVKTIAKENGYKGGFVSVQDTVGKQDVINQSAETDARFLRRLAAQEEFEFFVDHTGLHWHERRQHTVSTRSFTYFADPGRGDVISLSVESDLGRRAGSVSVRGRDPLQKATIESSSTSDSVDRTTLGDVIEVVDPLTGCTSVETRNATETVHSTAITSQEEIERESQARFRRAERSTLELSMRVVGDPALRAKSVIELNGLPPFLSGKYYMTEVKHAISSSGYTCDLKLTRDGLGRALRRQDRPQGGQKNRNEQPTKDELLEVEVVDPETGESRLEYRPVS